MSEKTEKKVNKDSKKERNLEDEKRTIFVGNLDKESKKEDLLKLFKTYGKIETVRFRNIVPEDLTKPKKFAFITKQIHPAKQTINAFVRFKEEDSALKAAEEANGLEFKSLHLRVDMANKSKEHDNKMTVFIGGLPFDISDEEIYKHFSDCGKIESVRIIRDNKTGIGKGFGYVRFKTSDAILLALKLEGSSINNRNIRVSRCVKKQKAGKKDGNFSNAKQTSIKGNNKQVNKFQQKWDQDKKPKKGGRKDFGEKKFSKSDSKKPDFKKKKFNKKPRHISTNKKENKKLKI